MSKKPSIAGIILIVLGILLLLQTLHIHVWGLAWPFVLIFLGFWFIYRKTRREDPYQQQSAFTYNAPDGTYTATAQQGGAKAEIKVNIGSADTSSQTAPPPPGSSAQAYSAHFGRAPEAPRMMGEKVKYSKFLGDRYIDCNNVHLQSVEISMFIGDLQVDLRGGKLGAGLNRMIVSGFLGDVIVLVPKDMPTFVHCSGFIGDVDLLGRRSSGFGNSVEGQSPTYQTAESKLYIAVNSFIGDIRVFPV